MRILQACIDRKHLSRLGGGKSRLVTKKGTRGCIEYDSDLLTPHLCRFFSRDARNPGDRPADLLRLRTRVCVAVRNLNQVTAVCETRARRPAHSPRSATPAWRWPCFYIGLVFRCRFAYGHDFPCSPESDVRLRLSQYLQWSRAVQSQPREHRCASRLRMTSLQNDRDAMQLAAATHD
jgi:hypothetical protein